MTTRTLPHMTTHTFPPPPNIPIIRRAFEDSAHYSLRYRVVLRISHYPHHRRTHRTNNHLSSAEADHQIKKQASALILFELEDSMSACVER